MNHKRKERHDENDVDQRPGDVKAKAERPENDEDDADNC